MNPQVIFVKALDKHKIYLKFDDDTEGVVSLEHLANNGIFKWWDDAENFNKVYIDEETNAIAWNENIDLDTLNLYLKVKGLTFEQWQQNQLAYAAN